MTTIITKIRDLIQDLLATGLQDSFTYYTSKIFELTEKNISAASILVYVNGALKSAANYTYDATTRKITYTASLTAGDNVLVSYSAYEKYSDSELKAYTKSALTYLATEKYKTFKCGTDEVVFPTPTESEENLMALLATILIGGDVKGWRSQEINITFQDNESKEKRIKNVIRQFQKSYGIFTYIKYDEKTVDEKLDEIRF
jgi:hypothetical protein